MELLRRRRLLKRNSVCAVAVDRTWSGPAWSPALSLSSLLISIQSLMNEKPYHNEPGFEQVGHCVCVHLIYCVMLSCNLAVDTTTAILWLLYRLFCISWHPQLRTGEFY